MEIEPERTWLANSLGLWDTIQSVKEVAVILMNSYI